MNDVLNTLLDHSFPNISRNTSKNDKLLLSLPVVDRQTSKDSQAYTIIDLVFRLAEFLVESRIGGDGECLAGDVVLGEGKRDKVLVGGFEEGDVVGGEAIQPFLS